MPNKRIDVDAIIDRFRSKEQAADPATPSSGFGWYYCKVDGQPYFMNDAGDVIPLSGGDKYFTLTVAGELTVDSNPFRIYNLTGAALTISKVHIAVDVAPTGATILVDVNENGTTIFTTQGNRPSIAISGFTGETTTIDDDSWANGNYLQIDVDQIGSTLPGEYLTVTIVAS